MREPDLRIPSLMMLRQSGIAPTKPCNPGKVSVKSPWSNSCDRCVNFFCRPEDFDGARAISSQSFSTASWT
jgi:hypothetical protein